MEITEAVTKARSAMYAALDASDHLTPEGAAELLHGAAHAAVALLAPFAERIEDDEEDAAEYEDALDRELRRRPQPDDHQSSRGYV